MPKRVTIEEMQRRIKVRFPNEDFKIIEFNGIKNFGRVECQNCKNIISVNCFENFLAKSKKYGCKKCQSSYIVNQDKMLDEINKRYNTLNIEVKNSHKYYTIECKQCKHIRQTYLRNIYKNLECGCKTGVLRKRTPQEFINEVNKNSCQGNYELVGEYKDQLEKILVRHDCGFIFEVRPSDIIYGHSRCPRCRKKRSKYELFIENYLKNNNLKFQVEKKLENSIQRFDFYLENEKHKIVIEYNGAQHYKEVEFFKNTLEDYQRRDEKKKTYCKEHNIDLYTIPYWLSDNEIKTLLDEIINKFND